MADTRREHLHRLATRLVRETEVIVVADLNAEGMGRSARGSREEPGRNVRQKAGLNRCLKDAAFGERVRQLEYQAACFGRTLIRVERFYPSSKTCAACGHRLDELRLGVREWTGPKCGTAHDRDINAARNLEAEGLRILEQTPAGAGEVRAPGDERACPVAVSARSPLRPSPCLEQG